MVMAASNMSGHIQKQLTRSLERIFEEAHLSGELKLSGRKLKDFPKVNKSGIKYNLCDTIIADLSKNRFSELPEEVTEFQFLEKLHLYHNAIRFIPDTIVLLQSLTYLDLSRNQLTVLPREVCGLPLQILLVAYNRLEALPEELGRMTALAELDVGCNEISTLPSRIGDLPRLRMLDLRHNLLVQLPIELTYLRLVKLDISGNRISVLPSELRKMKSLIDIKLTDNPLTSPPASLCARGRTHIFKYLERQAMKHEKNRMGRMKCNPLEARGHTTLDMKSHKRYYADNGYSTNDGIDKRWSQEIHSDGGDLQKRYQKKKLERSASEIGVVSKKSVSPAPQDNSLSLSHSESISNQQQVIGVPNHAYNDGLTPILVNSDEKKLSNHTQTYKEYKEALRQQRVNENSSVYRSRDQSSTINNDFHSSFTSTSTPNESWTEKHSFNSENSNKKDLQKPNFPNLILHNSSIGNNEYQVNGTADEKYLEQPYKKPTSPTNPNNEYIPRVPKTGVCYVDGNSEDVNNGSSKICKSTVWNNSNSEAYTFTMRREFERAKEEADLIDQLRINIETRLKMALPKDLAPALADGVVLCHLANHVKPRSVSSIYVPSPAVPKLPIARCRRNVDNFLEACKKIGVDENLICCASDILEGGRGMVRVAVTVAELLQFHQTRSPSNNSSLLTLNNMMN
ncbi:leucine-rich repeat and calponin homology domain-containing protein isoform X2 [Chelonus insularis]|uniref:leucine-rich repeat and calponin homology domain-containing protein isoform X2 n=1 Tax=Chelonus insularis TaxID=460826 RepID=UPI00158F30E8|nr:leucine-rich repeat and calponin homology domain-containing protein isoform X2 [Chelonus insularis]